MIYIKVLRLLSFDNLEIYQIAYFFFFNLTHLKPIRRVINVQLNDKRKMIARCVNF